jgi:hypothetical protein
MSTITLNLPDSLVKKLQERDDLDAFATDLLVHGLIVSEISEDFFDKELTEVDLSQLRNSLDEIKRGEVCSLDEARDYLKESRKNRRIA